MPKLLHELRDFRDLILVVSSELNIHPTLVEKDYWVMHCLWGLQNQGFDFELKGGTSLSKAFGVIHRFSEDIDIRINPPEGAEVRTGQNHNKPAHIESRKQYYDVLAKTIKIAGISSVERDTAFDDVKFRSAGIRLQYPSVQPALAGVKEGVLLELGFDDTTPNRPEAISSWAWDKANNIGVEVLDNRAQDVLCYAPTHTFVEKLQAISTKYRQQKDTGELPTNFLRHYYDVYCLLDLPEVQEFMGQDAYSERKQKRFRAADEQNIEQNPAFLLADANERKQFARAFGRTKSLYYLGQPDFEEILTRIHQWIHLM